MSTVSNGISKITYPGTKAMGMRGTGMVTFAMTMFWP